MIPRLGVAAVLGVYLLLPLAASPAAGQNTEPIRLRVEVAVEPESVTVGDRFHSAVRIAAPRGYRVVYPDFVTSDTLQAVGPVALTDPSDGTSAAIYPLVAWIAGVPLQAVIPITIVAADGRTSVERLRLRLPEVASVLPPPPEPVEPRPPRGLIEVQPTGGLPWWWWLALILGAILVALLAYWLLKRKDPTSELDVDPRTWALEHLGPRMTDQVRDGGNLAEVYRHVAWVLRGYLYRTDAVLGPELTTTEVVGAVEVHPALRLGGAELREILRAADRVKFARYLPSVAEAERFLGRAREWVAAYPAPQSDQAPSRAA